MKHVRCGRLAAALALAVSAGGCVINVDADSVVVRDEKQFTVGEGAELTLDTFDGSIEVQSWNKSQISVEIQKRGPDNETAAALDVKFAQDGSHVRVEAPAPKVMREFFGIGNVSGPSVSFVVRVPERLKLNATTRDGSISVARVNGSITLRSGDGSIRGQGLTGDLDARTDDGSLQLVDMNGRILAESGDGSIRIEGKVESLRARTDDGSIEVDAHDGVGMNADWEVSTGDGSIVVRVPRGFSAEIDGESRDGRVEADMPEVESARTDNGRGTLRGKIGSGGHTLKLRSGDGSIRLLNR
jgi:DUF4097 and DUF4098 domain-containing protein YvlB